MKNIISILNIELCVVVDMNAISNDIYNFFFFFLVMIQFDKMMLYDKGNIIHLQLSHGLSKRNTLIVTRNDRSR